MDPTLLLSADTRSTAGILLLTIVAVEYGGWFMLRIVRGQHPVTPSQATFARASHAHAGVLVALALVCQILADAARSGPLALPARLASFYSLLKEKWYKALATTKTRRYCS
ncbi:MAG TPA: hypothetical protein VGE04_12600 [Chloroflexia bacterium]|jgi:hypothetical protein